MDLGVRSSQGVVTLDIPDTVELCVRDRDRFPCLGVIHRLAPDGRIYCTQCGGKEPGVVYVRRNKEVRPAAST